MTTASDLLDELHAFFMGLLAGQEELRSAAIIEFDKSRAALRGAAAQADQAPVGEAYPRRGDWRHARWCEFERGSETECTCGLDALRAALAAPSRDAGELRELADEVAKTWNGWAQELDVERLARTMRSLDRRLLEGEAEGYAALVAERYAALASPADESEAE